MAHAAGLVQHVVLMGLPASSAPDTWLPLRRVVAGRIVSCHRPGDLVLTLVHRANSLGYGIAGLEPVLAPGVENLDVSAIVKGHSKYRLTVGRVLKLVDLEEADPAGYHPPLVPAAAAPAAAPVAAPAASPMAALAAAPAAASPAVASLVAAPAAAAASWRQRMATRFASTGTGRVEADFI